MIILLVIWSTRAFFTFFTDFARLAAIHNCVIDIGLRSLPSARRYASLT